MTTMACCVLLTQSPRKRMSPCASFVIVSVSQRQKNKVPLILMKSNINNHKAQSLYQAKSEWLHLSIHFEETLGLKGTEIRPSVYRRGRSCQDKWKAKSSNTSLSYILYQGVLQRNQQFLELLSELPHFRNYLPTNKISFDKVIE